MQTTKQTVIDRLIEHIQSECSPVDTDKRYDEMLDECYDFKAVGGPFAYMSPSRVLAEVDPIAYRCGKNDWADSEDFIEVGSSEYEAEEFSLQEEIEAAEADETYDPQELGEIRRKHAEIEEEIKAVKKYVF